MVFTVHMLSFSTWKHTWWSLQHGGSGHYVTFTNNIMVVVLVVLIQLFFCFFFNWHCTCSVSCVFRFVESWESFDNSITLDLWLCSHSLVLASFYCQYSNAHTIFIWIVVAATINFSLAWVQLYTNWGWLLLISDRNLTVQSTNILA